jgi:transcriptional regulator GlxA family with amidase domain
VPLVPGVDPLALGFLERFVAQADSEFAVGGDPRRLRLVRLAAEPGPVALWGGAKVHPDALYRERPAVDVLALLGSAGPQGGPPGPMEALLGYIRSSHAEAQHIIATGTGVSWCLQAGLTAGRRVVLSHLEPAQRARFDATLAAHSDPARDGHLWTASDPPRFSLLLLELFAELGGYDFADRLTIRLPWLAPMITAFAPVGPSGPDVDHDDDEGENVDPPRPGDAGGGVSTGGRFA